LLTFSNSSAKLTTKISLSGDWEIFKLILDIIPIHKWSMQRIMGDNFFNSLNWEINWGFFLYSGQPSNYIKNRKKERSNFIADEFLFFRLLINARWSMLEQFIIKNQHPSQPDCLRVICRLLKCEKDLIKMKWWRKVLGTSPSG
jgi:hypothetical protein